MQIVVVVAAGLIAGGAGWLLVERPRRRALAAYWAKPCQGWAWHARFRSAPATEIRAFLSVVVDSFGFSERRRLSFGPDDAVLAIYRACNPRPGWPDALELETFSEHLATRYGVDLQAIWSEHLTLGELFASTRAA